MAKRLYIQLYNARTGESLTLPINPDSIEIPNETEIKTYNILNYGEVSICGYKALKRINLSRFLPENGSLFSMLASLVEKLQYRPYSLKGTVEMIERWIEKKDIIRLIAADDTENLNSEFRIANFTKIINESVGDIGYNFELVEYRNPEGEAGGQPPKSNWVKLKERIINKYVPAQLVGQKGQTIYKLAKLTYGKRWKELAQKNNITDANKSIAGEIIEMLPIK